MKKLISASLVFSLALTLLLGLLPAARAEEAAPAEPVEYVPVITGEQTQVHVSTVDEFLNALAPDTEIILDAEFYDLSTATGYETKNGTYYRWEEVFDGVQLTIQNLSNLTIRAEGDDIKAHTVSARPRYAHVIKFENCSNIMVEGFTSGHTVEPGSCCGVVGVWAENTKGIQVTNSDIYECSWGGVYMMFCKDVTFNGNTIRDLGEEFMGQWHDGTPFMLHDTTGITINGATMRDDYIGD